jgi:hypothetical protein
MHAAAKWLLFGAAVAVAFGKGRPVTLTAQQKTMATLIARIARELDAPVDVALAFAWLESRLNPAAQGDLQWPTTHADKFRELVTVKLAQSPYAGDASLWHSYGLFQLLAPHFVGPREDPRVLLDPEVNARRGITFLKRQLAAHNGDVGKARLAFAGALSSSSAYQGRVLARLASALDQFREVA